MRYRATFWILLSLAFLIALWARPASAGLDTWHFGAGFNVGGIHFRVGYAEAGPFGSSFYFEAGQPFHYRGYGCSTYCYRQGPRYYHHPSCSAVDHHFSLHGYAPGYYFEHYGPPLPYPPPVYYYAPPRWHVRYYGHYIHDDRYYRDRHYRDRYYRDKHGRYKNDRGRKDRYRDDRHGYDRGRRDNDRHDRGRNDRGRDNRDRRNRGEFDRD